jgi:elongation factor G
MQVVRGEGRFTRAGCCGCYGHVILLLQVQQGDIPFQFLWEVPEEVIPAIYEQAIREGIMKELAEARVTTSLRIQIIGGSFHEVDSMDHAYRRAAQVATKEALQQLYVG